MKKIIISMGFCMLLMHVAENLSAQNNNLSIPDALHKITAVYKIEFVYETNLFTKAPQVNFAAPANTSRNIEEVLKQLLYPNGYVFLYVDETHYAIIKDARKKVKTGTATIDNTNNTRQVSGYIVDSVGKAIEGATVVASGARISTATNADGFFSFNVPSLVNTLSIFYVGAQSLYLQIPASGIIKAELHFNGTTLADVSVVSNGLQQLPKERATGAFAIVTRQQLELTPTPNVLQRLETQVPGLKLDFLTGDNTFAYRNPGTLTTDPAQKSSIYTISVRGTSTYTADAYPLIVVDGFPADIDIRSLNPNDIEQVTVLKDAAAASIWGIRAANGVIVIQTKKGKFNQKPVVNFNSNFGFQAKTNLNNQNLLTSAQMLNFEKELVDKNLIYDASGFDFAPGASQGVNLFFAYKRGDITEAQLNQQVAALSATTNYDQYGKYFLQSPTTQNYNVSVSGGSNAYTYFTSASYAKELTGLKGTSTDRITITANQNFKLFNLIDIGTSLKFANFNSKYNSIGLSALINRQLPFMPYDKVVDENGNGINYYQKYNQTFSEKLLSEGFLDYSYNYLDEQRYADNTYKETNLTGNFSVSSPLPFVKGLSANVLFSIEKAFGYARNYQNAYTFAARDFMNTGSYYDESTGTFSLNVPYGGIFNTQQSNRNNYSLRGQLNYNNHLGNNHELNAIAGAEIRQTFDLFATDQTFGWNDVAQIAQQAPTTYTSIYGYNYTLPFGYSYAGQQRRYLSYFSNAAYTFMNRYTVSGSVRYDDYNNFGLDVKYRAKPFYSTGISWNISREKFMENASWLSSWIVRATYGTSGNIDRSLRPDISLSLTGPDNITGLPTAYIFAPANPYLQWETTKTFNIGTDAAFFNNRLNITVDVYNKKGSNLFALFNTDPTYGFSSITRNTATLAGKGIEGVVSGDIIRTQSFTWNASLVFAYNNNKVTDNRYETTTGIQNSPFGSGLITGYPINYLFVYRFAGLDSTGQSLVYDQKGAIINSSESLTDINDLKYAGNTEPKYFGAFNHSIKYKNFTLAAQFSYRLGYVFLRNSIPFYIVRGNIAYSLNSDIDKRWRKPGDEATTNVPGLSNFNYTSYLRYTYSDLNVLPGDYVRLQQVSFGYTIPDNVTQKLKIKNLNIQAVARNLGLVWRKNNAGIDPDFQIGSTGETLKLRPTPQYTLSINANF